MSTVGRNISWSACTVIKSLSAAGLPMVRCLSAEVMWRTAVARSVTAAVKASKWLCPGIV